MQWKNYPEEDNFGVISKVLQRATELEQNNMCSPEGQCNWKSQSVKMNNKIAQI